ncbi:MAG: S-adenosylmethionine:tRNA ribosyltransferase-isomerase, partial [Bacteroidota bacterium]
LKAKGISQQFLTLHVGAGTFRPVKTENALEHPMHRERVIVTRENVEIFAKAGKILPVGTTSVRTLESLYWYGVNLLDDPKAVFRVEKLAPYQERNSLPSRKEVGEAILKKMDTEGFQKLVGETEIMIVPGYSFKACDALITNFHQPGSTLMLLIAALIGEEWKNVYSSALMNYYRFLSYGDSSLLFPIQNV